MRLGVLDIGSNTGHLLIVDAYSGAPPLPAHSYKEPLRLAEHLDAKDRVTDAGISALVKFADHARTEALDRGCTTILAFATSAVREAKNVDAVLAAVRDDAEVDLQVLAGEDEAQLTFLAARRWFGWSAGRIGMFDIGGGSLEIAAGSDEVADAVHSVPLGAGRLTRRLAASGGDTDELRLHVRTVLAEHVGAVRRGGEFDKVVATSKTFRSLARMCGAASSSEGQYVRRMLGRKRLSAMVKELGTMKVEEIAELPGVSENRAHQMLAGGIVALAAMDLFDVEELEICPWALREGVLLRHMDHLTNER